MYLVGHLTKMLNPPEARFSLVGSSLRGMYRFVWGHSQKGMIKSHDKLYVLDIRYIFGNDLFCGVFIYVVCT